MKYSCDRRPGQGPGPAGAGRGRRPGVGGHRRTGALINHQRGHAPAGDGAVKMCGPVFLCGIRAGAAAKPSAIDIRNISLPVPTYVL